MTMLLQDSQSLGPKQNCQGAVAIDKYYIKGCKGSVGNFKSYDTILLNFNLYRSVT